MSTIKLVTPTRFLGFDLIKEMNHAGSTTEYKPLNDQEKQVAVLPPRVMFDDRLVKQDNYVFDVFQSTIRFSEPLSLRIPYFEVVILEMDTVATVMIGCQRGITNMVDSDINCYGSFGYESSGDLWTGAEIKSWGIPFGPGDVIGVGIDGTNTIVITFNGRARRLTNWSPPTFATFIPCVQVQRGYAKVFMNFGQLPFSYNL